MSLGQTVFVVWFPHLLSPSAIYLIAALFGFTYSGVMSSILVCTRIMVSANMEPGHESDILFQLDWDGSRWLFRQLFL